MTQQMEKIALITLAGELSCLLFSPKADVKMDDLDSVSMAAFGQKETFA